MKSTIPEQTTIIVNKDIARLLSDFLQLHGYEFRRLFDDRYIRPRDRKIYRSVPSMESRTAWLELIAELKGEKQHAL